MPQNRYSLTPFNGMSKEDFMSLTKPAVVNYTLQDSGQTAVIDVDGFIGRDIVREWMTGERSENTVDNIKNVLREITAEKIIVNINSPGGDLNDGLVIADMLKSKRATIVTNIMGFSASAATVIGQAGDVRRMSNSAFYLMHRVMFGVMGYINLNTVQEMSMDMDVIDNQLIRRFESRSNMTADQIADLMDEGGGYGRWIDADTALEYGLVDEVYDPGDEDDENLDRMDAEDRENRMTNIRNLSTNSSNWNPDYLNSLVEKVTKQEKEHQTNSGSAADARGRNNKQDLEVFELEINRKTTNV